LPLFLSVIHASSNAVSRITRVSGSNDPLPVPSMFPPYDPRLLGNNVFWSLPQKEVEFLELPGRVRAYLLRSRDTPVCGAVAAIPACLRAIAARHFEGLTLRRARNCRFS